VRDFHIPSFVPNAYRLLPSFAVPELLKTKGQVVILGSGLSQIRLPNESEYCISKHAMLRFAEFIAIGEYHFSSSIHIEC
jgi:short-subunit dehydrogenase